MTPATTDDIAELLRDDLDEPTIERIAAIGASLDEIGEAIDDLEYERRYGASREASSYRVEELRTILEELPAKPAEALELEPEAVDEDPGLVVIEGDELAREVS